MKPCRNAKAAFTLVELMASITILAVMTFLLFSAFDQTSKAWLQGEARVETYSSARAALDYMSRELVQAMVNSNSFQFFGTTNAVAFIAPSDDRLGETVDVAEVVYRLSQPSASAAGPQYPGDPFTNSIPPYRLMRRYSPYSETQANCRNYGLGTGCTAIPWDFYLGNVNWMETSPSNRVGVLAENIMSLSFVYVTTNNYQFLYWNSTNAASIWQNELGNGGILFNKPDIAGAALSPYYTYMTNHAPAGIYITIGAVDSHTAAKLASLGTTSGSAWNTITNQATKFFTTFVEIPNQ